MTLSISTALRQTEQKTDEWEGGGGESSAARPGLVWSGRLTYSLTRNLSAAHRIIQRHVLIRGKEQQRATAREILDTRLRLRSQPASQPSTAK